MPRDLVKGRRVKANPDGTLPALRPGEYGRAEPKHTLRPGSRTDWWQVCAPDGIRAALDPKIYTVTEFPDDTITVVPAIDLRHLNRRGGAYHGHLIRGKWT
jgi:hypothetical protein